MTSAMPVLHTSAPIIAVLIPCYNEEAAIASVVRDFRAALPGALIYVYDNNSRDKTAAAATEAGAIVRHEPLQGKGNVVRRMFADVEADVYVMVDGDDTYHAASAPALIHKLLAEQLDIVNAARVTDVQAAYRPGHRFGNPMLPPLVAFVFGKRTADMLSGYRVFSRRFVKSFPTLVTGFEIEPNSRCMPSKCACRWPKSRHLTRIARPDRSANCPPSRTAFAFCS